MKRRRPIWRWLASLRPRTWRPHSRRSAAWLAFVGLALFWTLCSRGERRSWPRAVVLEAIRFVESSHRDAVPDGDQGKAIGPFQIHLVYWQDAQRADPTLGGSYQDCRQRAYAERVVAAFMQHYVPEAWAAGEAEILARVHNGGPKGAQNPATLGYWQRVRAQLP